MVCTDLGLSEDAAGRVSLNRCGSPAASDWPYPCAVTTANPLRIADDGCLWAPPYGDFQVTRHTGSVSSPGTASAGSPIERTVSLTTISNTDPVQTVDVLMQIELVFIGTPSAGADYTFSRQILAQLPSSSYHQLVAPDYSYIWVYQGESSVAVGRQFSFHQNHVARGLAPGDDLLLDVGLAVSIGATGTFAVSSLETTVNFILAASNPDPNAP